MDRFAERGVATAGTQAIFRPLNMVTVASEQEDIGRLAAAQTGGVVFSDIARQLNAENFLATVCVASD